MRLSKNPGAIGRLGENLAKKHLRQQGITIIAENYHTRYGEIDLIAQEGETLLFIEVRVRNNPRYGSALESITPQKQARILKSVAHYLQHHNIGVEQNMRIDVIGIEATPDGADFTLEWVKNAFSA